MKSHHTTTLHQFTLLSKRSSTSFEESSHKFKKSLKKHIYTFWKDSSYSIISPILEIILCQSYIGWKFRYYTTIILHETDELQLLFSRHTKLSSVTPTVPWKKEKLLRPNIKTKTCIHTTISSFLLNYKFSKKKIVSCIFCPPNMKNKKLPYVLLQLFRDAFESLFMSLS